MIEEAWEEDVRDLDASGNVISSHLIRHDILIISASMRIFLSKIKKNAKIRFPDKS